MPSGATAAATDPAAEIVVAIERRAGLYDPACAERLEVELSRRFPGHPARVLVVRVQGGSAALVPPHDSALVAAPAPEVAAPSTGQDGAMAALLRAGAERSAAAMALVADARDGRSAEWLGALLAPVLEGGFDCVRPAYLRHRQDAPLNTGVVYPLLRAAFGKRLRQPLGRETALSLTLARRLLLDPDWRRDPGFAGSEAWLVGKVLAGPERVCQAWLGPWPGAAAPPEEASEALARVLGQVFRELERHAGRWQRVDGSAEVPSFGEAGTLPGEAPRVSLEALVGAFRLGQSELAPLWSHVLPPATLLALRRCAACSAEAFQLEDRLWARIVYDFAVAWFAKLVERRQLLASMTPLYRGWTASFLRETRDLDDAATEARIEALCRAFEQEKRYLVARWRWPDGFNP
ncbi:hypothetical protein [Anaeromyxobacter paludicola]|uniref:Glycosyl transferase family 2 n=1 Tax=Anaeromyxobacter paludicola TaxID=2918171 RepID=A0ABM7XE93_9BACT|nr:hypothetical protein [Anaeromyxobacter paludicola]BDG10222.1 hypothetical protein AMPC_33350 [Anaeromyxobacter paludicola]